MKMPKMYMAINLCIILEICLFTKGLIHFFILE